MVQRALDQPAGSGVAPSEAGQSHAGRASDGIEQRWPLRRRFAFVVLAAMLCWAIPVTIVYLLLVAK